MRTYDVHLGEMPDPDADLIDRLRSQFVAAQPPAPGEALARMMAAGPTGTSPRPETRSQNVLSKILAQTGSKVAAALAGAALMLGALGATGALTGPMQMILDTHDEAAACPEEATDDEPDATDESTAEESSAEDGADVGDSGTEDGSELEDESEPDDEECETEDDIEPAAAPTPGIEGEELEADDEAGSESNEPVVCADGDHGCWVSNAAKNKSTQCRNHGAYVSQVARAKGHESEAFYDTNCDGELDEDEQAARDAGRGAHSDSGEDEGDDDADEGDDPEDKKRDDKAAGKDRVGKAAKDSGQGNGRGAHSDSAGDDSAGDSRSDRDDD